MIHGQAGLCQNRFDVAKGLPGLLGNAAGDKLAGGGVDGHLTGGDEKRAAVDGLRVGADGGGGLFGGNDLLHGVSSFFRVDTIDWQGCVCPYQMVALWYTGAGRKSTSNQPPGKAIY